MADLDCLSNQVKSKKEEAQRQQKQAVQDRLRDLEQRTALSATAQSEAAEAAEAEAASKASAETQLSRAAKRAKQQEPAGAAAERGLGMLESGIATLRKAAVSGLSAKVRAALNKHVAQVHALCVG